MMQQFFVAKYFIYKYEVAEKILSNNFTRNYFGNTQMKIVNAIANFVIYSKDMTYLSNLLLTYGEYFAIEKMKHLLKINLIVVKQQKLNK